MQKLLLSAITVFLYIGISNAQPLTFGKHNLGLSFGIPNEIHSNYSSKSPSVNISYHYGFSDKIGIGYISAGGMISFFGADYKVDNSGVKYNAEYSYTTIGPRAAYHFDMSDITGNKTWDLIDVYAGMFLGLQFEKMKTYDSITDITNTDNKSRLATDIFAGIRYSLTDNVGIYSELGFGLNSFNFGVSYRL